MAPVTYAMHLVDNQEARAVGPELGRKLSRNPSFASAHLRNEHGVDLVSCESLRECLPNRGCSCC